MNMARRKVQSIDVKDQNGGQTPNPCYTVNWMSLCNHRSTKFSARGEGFDSSAVLQPAVGTIIIPDQAHLLAESDRSTFVV